MSFSHEEEDEDSLEKSKVLERRATARVLRDRVARSVKDEGENLDEFAASAISPQAACVCF